MPIKSYLAHPHEGKKSKLIEDLLKINQCEVIPAQNKEIVVIITDTDSKTEEDNLRAQLDAIDSLKLLAMVSGFNTPKKS